MTHSIGSLLYFVITVLLFVTSNKVICGVQGFTTARSSAALSLSSYRNQESTKGKNDGRNNAIGIQVSGAQQRPKSRRKIVGLARRFAWPAERDPRGVSIDYPLTVTRIAITVASCYLMWFAQAQYSNVMASSALTLICSTVFDKRLGQAAFCESFANMCSTAIIPTKNLPLILGLVTSVCYEIMIHSADFCLGVGGRLGATAFLTTSAIAFKTGIKTGLGRYAFAGGSRALKLFALS